MLLIQMAGFPGSGKSTLAKEICKNIDAIILDIDVIKSPLIMTGVSSHIVANASYNTLFSLCDYYLSLNKNVIIDTPCYYEETIENGLKVSRKFGADYKYVECRTDSYEEINRRLKSRERRLSQINCAEESMFYSMYDKSKHPKELEIIVVDSSLPISSYIKDALDYINN